MICNKGETLRYTATKRAEVSSMSFFYGASSMSTFLSPYQIGGGSAGASAADNFDDGTIDPTFWTLRQTQDNNDVVDTTISVAETGGQLVMTSGGNVASGAEAGYISGALDFTGKQVAVELAQHDLTFGLNSYLTLQLDLANRLRLGPDNSGNLVVQERIASAPYVTRQTVAYNNTTHRFLRIRSAGLAVVYEFSADGITYTPFHVKVVPFSLTAVKIFIHQMTGIAGVTAGKFTKFDNFVFDTSTGGNSIASYLNVVGGAVAGLIFTKSAATGWGTGGFSSGESITGDGYIEFIATESTTDRVIGLSTADPDQNYTSVEYGFFLENGGALYCFESGSLNATVSPYVANVTRLRIERVGTTLTYYKNSVSQRVVTPVTTAPLFVDTAFNHNAGTIGPIIMVL